MKDTHPLKKNHQWKAEPGCKILVADRGAVRLEYPEAWLVDADENTIRLHDLPPPADNARLQMTVQRLPVVEIDLVPLDSMLDPTIAGGTVGEIVRVRHHGYRLVWRRMSWLDNSADDRPAVSFTAVALAPNVQVVLTLDCWESDVETFAPIWDGVLRSLRLGQVILDPLLGAAIDPGLN